MDKVALKIVFQIQNQDQKEKELVEVLAQVLVKQQDAGTKVKNQDLAVT